MSDWLPISKIPALMSTEPVSADIQAEQPFAYPVNTEALEEIQPGSEPIIPTACVKRAFDLTLRNIGQLIVVTLVLFGVNIVVDVLLNILLAAMGIQTAPAQMEDFSAVASEQTLTAGQTAVVLVLNIGSALISLLLTLGGLRISLNVVSGKPFSVGMLFGEGDKLVRAFVAQILFALMVAFGLILLIVPGIYLALRYGQFMTAIVDKDLGIMDSFKYSSDLTEKNRLNVFVIALFSLFIVIAGCIALIVGLLFAYPMIMVMWVITYRWMQYGGRAVLDDPITKKPILSELPD